MITKRILLSQCQTLRGKFIRLVHNQPSIPANEYDVVVIGAGHNGLVAASYMAKCGMNVCVLERRHIVGGAAVTEEIIPGFKFSRASYLLSLFRPVIIQQLELKKHGLRYHMKDPTSFTPIIGTNKSILLGSDEEANQRSIAQFSQRDAIAYPHYERWLGQLASAINTLLDLEPPVIDYSSRKLSQRLADIKHTGQIFKAVMPLGVRGVCNLLDLMASPVEKVLKKWFESEPLMATLASDGVIGAIVGPKSPGSGYVLLHHVMGELDNYSGKWAQVIGGMGAVSESITKAAKAYGAHIFTSCPVKSVLIDGKKSIGVVLDNGTKIFARKCVLSNATPKVTFLDLLPKDCLPADFLAAIKNIDYGSPVTKINIAVDRLPNFECAPSASQSPSPYHQTTIHLNCETMESVHEAFLDMELGNWSRKPFIEMTIPTSVDETMAPKGCHVVQLFTQYTPYHLKDGRQWDEETKRAYSKIVIETIENYCPGFQKSIIGFEVLTPPDLERIFGLTGGNIFHGAMSLDQLYHSRPALGFGNYRTPIQGYYLCGSGAHPGGGVMGAPGRLAALAAMKDCHVETKGLSKFNGKV